MNAPKCSLQTAISIRGDLRGGSAWASSSTRSAVVQDSKQARPKSPLGVHESQPGYERHSERRQRRKRRRGCCCWRFGGCCRSVVNRYPRLSLFLLHLVLHLIKGLACGLLVTRWGLEQFDVPARLDVARSELSPIGAAIEATRCPQSKYPDVTSLSELEVAINEATDSAQRLVDANDAAIVAAASATSQCVHGLEAGLDAFSKAVMSSPEASSRSEVTAFECVEQALAMLKPHKSSQKADRMQMSLPAVLEQQLWSRVADATRVASLRDHERVLRQLPAVVNESTSWTTAGLRASVASEMSRLESLVTGSRPSSDANATARRLVGPDDARLGLADVVSSLVESVKSPLARAANVSAEVGGWKARGERKAEYLTGLMSYQLRRSRLKLDEEFHVAQATQQSITASVEALMQDEITAIVAESRATAKQQGHDRGVDGGVGKLDAEIAWLSEGPASHTLQRLPRRPASVATPRRPVPTTRSSPVSMLSPWWWWETWPSDPAWSNATDGQDVPAGDDNSTLDDGGTVVESVLMNGAVSDPQRTLVWYAIKGGSFRAAFLMFELTTGIFTDTLLTTPQLDARRIAAMRQAASGWAILTCRCTALSFMLALGTRGREFASIVGRNVGIGVGSLAATLVLMGFHRDHLNVCPEYHRGVHLDDTIAVGDSVTSATRTWFMEMIEPRFGLSVVLEGHGKFQKAEDLDSHASAMFGALESQIAAIWSEQVELHTWTKQLVESADEMAVAVGMCKAQESASAPVLVNASVAQQCRLAKGLTNWKLSPPHTLTTSLEPLKHGEPLELDASENSTECLRSRRGPVKTLEHRYLCAVEEITYLTLTSWLLLSFVLGVSNLVGDLSLLAVELVWWRFLSSNRVSFVGYCSEDGRVETPEDLPQLIKDWWSDVRWDLTVWFLQGSSSVAGVVVVWFVLLS